MRQVDEGPDDARLIASLEAVDATLAGEPVDPAHAELAELALLLASERPVMDAGFAGSLDDAVQRSFVRPGGDQAGKPTRVGPALRRRWWVWMPAAGLAAALIAAVVIVAGSGTNRPVVVASSGATKAPAAAPHRTGAGASAAASAPSVSSSPGAEGSLPQAAASSSQAAASSSQAATVQPAPNGRKVIQGAQMTLTTAPSRIDDVAQEVFVVVGRVSGIVNRSTVTAGDGPGGYAEFQLSIPSASLPQAMASLSSLRYAKVASRTDSTQDVNDHYQADVRALADARALRTSLLTQLANATTQAQIDSLTARVHDAEASISSDEATLRNLNRQINYSQVSLTITGGPVPVPVRTGSASGFGLGKAAHDAGRVLTVAAGIVLIAAAALLPVVLLGALGWWIAGAIRRRRREHALDIV